MDIFHACVIRCPRGQRQMNRQLIIASHFSRSAASSYTNILRVNVENRHSFFHRSAIGHLLAPLHLGVGSHEGAVEEEGQQRCLMEVACNGDKDEESVSLCVTRVYTPAPQACMFERKYWSEPKRHTEKDALKKAHTTRKRHRKRHRTAKEQPQQAN